MGKNILSSKQNAILKFIKHFIETRPYPPSIRDIQDGCDLSSTSVVDYNLKILEEKNYLKRDTSISRGIYLENSSYDNAEYHVTRNGVDQNAIYDLLNNLSDIAFNFDILIVDDCSIDSNIEIILKFIKENKKK